jgi:integrase
LIVRKLFYLIKRGKYWHVCWNASSDLVAKNETGYHTTGQTSRRAAERWCLAQIRRGKQVGGSATLRQYIEPFFIWDTCPHVRRLTDEGKSITKRYVKEQRRLIDNHILPHPIADRKIAEITRANVVDFRSDLLKVTGSRTVNRTIGVLKIVFNEAVYREELKHNTCAMVGNISYREATPGVFTQDELHLLFPPKSPGPWIDISGYTCFLLAFTTGMRRGELLALRWRNVDPGNRFVRVREAWKDLDEKGPPKWGNMRDEPLCDQAVSALRDLFEASVRVAPDDLVFCKDDGSRYGQTWWRSRFKRALNLIGIFDEERRRRNLKPHSFRHTFVTLVRSRVDSAILREVVGHADESTTAGYTHFSIEQKRVIAEVIDEVLRPVYSHLIIPGTSHVRSQG